MNISEIIDAIGAEIVARVAEARNIMFDNGGSQRILVPEYTNNLEGVKKFILYYYSSTASATSSNCCSVLM